MLRRTLLAIGVLTAFASAAPDARADFADGPRGTWLSVGANVGGANHAGDAAFVLGGEASLVRWNRGQYAGFYLDGIRDFDEGRTRFSVGPVVGYWVFGMDLGYLADVGQGRWRSGGVVRPFLSVGVLAPYARFGFRGEKDGGPFQEFGVLLKLPVEASSLRSRSPDPRHVARSKPGPDPDAPLPPGVTLLRAHGEPVAVVATGNGVEWVAFDGQHGKLAGGDVRWVMVDDRVEVVWFLARTTTGELFVLDLKAIEPVPVRVVTGLAHDDYVGVAYEEAGGNVTRLLDETGVYEGRVELLLGPGDATLRYERGIYDQTAPPADGAPAAEGERSAVIAPGALPLLRKLVQRGAGRRLVLPVAEAAPLPRVATVAETRCGQAELCGIAEKVPGTRYQRVLVSHACGDACHVRYQLYDPASQEFFDVKTRRRSKAPIDEGEPPSIVDAWVSRDGRALVMDGVVYDLEKGLLYGGAVPRRFGGGFVGGGYRLE